MFLFSASGAVVSKGYQNKPAVQFSETADFVQFRIGTKVYDPKAEDKHRWVNMTIKCFDPTLIARIRNMKLKEGACVDLVGSYDEDVWEDEQTKQKRSRPFVRIYDIDYSNGGGKRSGDGQKTADSQSSTPEPTPESTLAPAPEAPAAQEDVQMPGNFTGYESFGGGNAFFSL